MRYKLTDDGVNLLRRVIEGTANIGHSIGWASSGSGFFFYITWDPERAKKAEAALQKGGHLCDTDLGSVKSMTFLQEVK